MPGNSIVQHLTTLSAQELRRDFLVSTAGARTYGEMRESMLAYAGWLSSAEGIRPGDRVAICLPKTSETVQLIYGVLAVGAAHVPLQYQGAPDRLAAMLDGIRPALFITTEQMAARIRLVSGPHLAHLRVVAVGEDEESLASLCRGIPLLPVIADVSPGDLAIVFFTSGSTGEPKGVMWSQRGLTASIGDTVRRRPVKADDRLMSVAQLHYSSSCEIFYPALAGASVYVCGDREMIFAAHLAEILERERVTIWGSVSTALRLLVEQGHLADRNLSALRFVEFFGERVPIATLRQAMSLLPQAEFCCIYGATEAFNLAEYRVPRPLVVGADDLLPLGLPCAGYEVSLRDESGAEVVPGEIGEICVSGPGVAMGYWNHESQNVVRRLLGVADSFRTGDLARVGRDGLIDLVGRGDQMIKVRGHRVELGEIEAVAKIEPRVGDAVAFAVGDRAESIEIVLALLTAEERSDPAEVEQAVRRVMRARLPRQAEPSRILICRTFPLLSSGKVDRRALQAAITGETADRTKAQAYFTAPKVSPRTKLR